MIRVSDAPVPVAPTHELLLSSINQRDTDLSAMTGVHEREKEREAEAERERNIKDRLSR